MYGAIFNSQNLGLVNYQITKINVSMPKTKIAKFELVQADGQVVTSRFFGERVVNVSGRILANSLDEMQSRLDTLKTWINGYEKPLDITIANTNRRYTATVQNFNFTTQGYYCEWNIDFSCDSLASDQTSTTLTMGTYTSSPTLYTNTIAGTYFAEPSFDFTVNQVIPYWTNKYLQFTNPVTQERIRMTRSWLPSDRVVINGKTKTVSIFASTATIISTLDSITGFTTSHTLTLDTTNEIEGTGCAKIVMAGATTSTTLARLNSTAISLSSSDGTVLIPIFIPTPTSGSVATVRFTIGSDATLATNFGYWDKTTQWDSSPIATNAWNYFAFDLSIAFTSSTGTPSRTAIISIQVELRNTTNFQLNGWLVDYISTYVVSSTSTALDYENLIPYLDTGSSTITVSDEFTSRNITMTGSYFKRYL